MLFEVRARVTAIMNIRVLASTLDEAVERFHKGAWNAVDTKNFDEAGEWVALSQFTPVEKKDEGDIELYARRWSTDFKHSHDVRMLAHDYIRVVEELRELMNREDSNRGETD